MLYAPDWLAVCQYIVEDDDDYMEVILLKYLTVLVRRVVVCWVSRLGGPAGFSETC